MSTVKQYNVNSKKTSDQRGRSPAHNLSVHIVDSHFGKTNDEDANNFIHIGPPQQALSNKHPGGSSDHTTSPSYATPATSLDQPTPTYPLTTPHMRSSTTHATQCPSPNDIDSWGRCLSHLENTLKVDFSILQVIGHE